MGIVLSVLMFLCMYGLFLVHLVILNIESKEEAQNAPTPITNYALFHDGKYVTNEQMNDKIFLKLVER